MTTSKVTLGSDFLGLSFWAAAFKTAIKITMETREIGMKFVHVTDVVLVSLLLILNIFHILF